jgi:broad specificity phosphatase PhoE
MISFVRHGETAHNREGRLQGRADLELSERGADQAARLASRFTSGPIANVFSSPLRRARQTAAAIAGVCGCAVEVDDRLIELDYGDWDGRPLSEIPPEVWTAWRADPNFAPPGGESLVAVTARVESFCTERLASGGRIVAVSHVSPIKAAVAWSLGVDERATWRMQLGLATISAVGARPDGTGYLSSYNDAAHLEPPRQSA